MDGDDEKWLVEGGERVEERVEEPNEEEEDNSLASNSSDSSFVESSLESSSRVEVEDVTDEDCAERRFQVGEPSARFSQTIGLGIQTLNTRASVFSHPDYGGWRGCEG